MSKRAKPRWGLLGVVSIPDAGETADQPFADLVDTHLKITESTLKAEVRARLQLIRNFYMRSRLYRAASPAQAECNAALTVVNDRIGAFLAVVGRLGRIPDWALSDAPRIEKPSPFLMFMTLPTRLRVLAEIALENAAPAQGRDADWAALLVPLSRYAAALADTLSLLDHASREDVVSRLPWTADYEMESFPDVARLTQRLGGAVGDALADGLKRGGPRRFPELLQAIDWLRGIYERHGGRFTHTPRLKTEYDGKPHSAAGRFVVDFFKLCDPKLSEQTISSAMAEVISSSRPNPQAVGLSDRLTPLPARC